MEPRKKDTVPPELREIVEESAAQSTPQQEESEPLQEPIEETVPTSETAEAPATREDAQPAVPPPAKQMEQVMNQGMSFLAGMFKMMTGEEMPAENQRIEIDEQTGEVVMRFKMPQPKS